MKLLLTGAFSYSEEQKKELQDLGFEILFVQDERKDIPSECFFVDVVVCNGLFLYNNISRFNNLKFIQLLSAGLDRVPLTEIGKREIILKNAGNVYSIPMAEWAVCKTLEILKESRFFYNSQKKRLWQKCRDIEELYLKTVAVLGVGNTGIQTAMRFKAMGCRVLGVDICKKELDAVDQWFDMSNLEDALEQSDIVVICLPLTSETKNLFSFDLISRMKQGSILVNISRGGLLSEPGLLKALNLGKIRAAALDVFENEPLDEHSALWKHPRVIVSPHNSFISTKNNERMFLLIKDNLSKFIGS